MKRQLTAIDLFCGAGGLSCGLERAGVRVLAGFDADAVAHGTYVANHGADTAVRTPTDIRALTAAAVWSLLGRAPGELDIVAGGPPCQGFSMAGNRAAGDERNLLVFHFARLVTELRPRFFVMENVVGLLSMKTSRGRLVLDSLDEVFRGAGYRTNIPQDADLKKRLIVNAADYGVPQRRRRVLVFGALEAGDAVPSLPAPSHHAPGCLPFGSDERTHVTVQEAIGDLPDPEASGEVELRAGKSLSDYAKLIRGDASRTWNHLPSRHKPWMIQRMERQAPGTPLYDTWAHAWVRLVAGEPAPTVKENHNAPFVHPELPRVVTPRECARLQSFPDGFRFEGPKSKQLVQIGNAVPPLLGEAIGRALVAQHEATSLSSAKVATPGRKAQRTARSSSAQPSP